MGPTTNQQHQMYLPASSGAILNPSNQTENSVDNLLNNPHSSNIVRVPNNITMSVPAHLKNIDEYQLMSNNMVKQEISSFNPHQNSNNNQNAAPVPANPPQTSIPMPESHPSSDHINRKGSNPSDTITNDGDENDIFELMEDLKSELKFTFEEEIDIPFPEAAITNATAVLPNQQSIMNHQPTSGAQFLMDPNNTADFQVTSSSGVSAFTNSSLPTFSMDNCPNYVNNVLSNGRGMPPMNDFNKVMFQGQSLPANLIHTLPPQTTNSAANLGSIDAMSTDMKMYLQSQQQNIYMFNSNNYYPYIKNVDANLTSQYNHVTNGHITSNNQQVQGNRFFCRQQRQHPPQQLHSGHYLSSHMTPHVKKPLNAFMLYMKDVRPKLIKETNTKDSIAINKIIGKMWQSLSKQEQAKYFEMARNEREIHRQLYPNYTTCDQYVISKKKRRKRDKGVHDEPMMKKCRARFGLDNQDKWCKPCRRKKKCIRFLQDDEPLNLANVEAGNFVGSNKGSYKNNYGKLVSPPLNANSENDDPGMNTVQETLNSTVISPTNYSCTAIQQQQQHQSDYSGHLGTNNFSQNLINERDNKLFNNDSLFPLSNTTTTSTFNESLVDLLGNISPIPFKHESIPMHPKQSSCPSTKPTSQTSCNEGSSETANAIDGDNKKSIFTTDPVDSKYGFEPNFDLDESDIFKLEDINDQQQPTSPNKPSSDNDPVD